MREQVTSLDEAVAEPNTAEKAGHFVAAVVRHVADGARRVPPQEFERRLAVCRGCEYCRVDRMICRHENCGCRLRVKAAWRSESCPLGAWNIE